MSSMSALICTASHGPGGLVWLTVQGLTCAWQAGVASCTRPYMGLVSRCGFMYKARKASFHVQGLTWAWPAGIFSCVSS